MRVCGAADDDGLCILQRGAPLDHGRCWIGFVIRLEAGQRADAVKQWIVTSSDDSALMAFSTSPFTEPARKLPDTAKNL